VLKCVFKNNVFFLVPYFFFFLSGAFLLVSFSPGQLHLFFNGFHSEWANVCFSKLTYLGDGWTAVLISLLLVFYKLRFALITLLSYGLSSLIAQVLKHFIFEGRIRPLRFFEGVHGLYLVPGVDMNSYYSFPSGHSTTAFAVFFCLALFTSQNWLKAGCFVIALLTAYSRVYLSQHFFADIYAGSVVGVGSAFIIYWLLREK